jgi:Beta propeller domain
MMKRFVAIGLVLLVCGALVYSFSAYAGRANVAEPASTTVAAAGKPEKTMKAFSSEDALKEHFKKIAEKQERARREMQKSAGNTTASSAPSPASPMADTSAAKAEEYKAGKDDDGITNNQHVGVDEGGIVKVHGDHLVILRRGRLFTVKVGSNSLAPVSSVNAYAPGVNPSGDWYDEMLVSKDTVVVIGYSYGRGGTEINLFDINGGNLKFRSSYHLRSNDYYSSRNYASRLIGNKLVFYTPQYMNYYGGDPMQRFPAVRKWHKGVTNDEFKTIVSATRVYRTPRSEESANSSSALHTVTVCDLASREMQCEGTAVLGAPGRIFYVSPKSVYVWTTEWNRRGSQATTGSMVYSMPLDGSAPSALGVSGVPVDQFSFLESDDNHLNVLVRSEGYGEQMWGSERTAGDVALFRTPIDDFNDGSQSASRDSYRNLPNVEGYTMQNRFVGDHILYGAGNGWGRQKNTDGANLYAVNWKTGGTSSLYLDHSVDRIEQLGGDAVVVGTNGQDLYFSPVSLDRMPTVKKSFVRKNAS